ncbi:MAG: peptide deformylase [Elusimicrobiota bacterium]
MTVLRITKYPEKVLSAKSKKIEGWSRELTELVENMFETMYAVGGVGLAANQVGIPIRLAVIDVRPNNRPKKIVLINPKITKSDGKAEEPEGCLSLPGLYKRLNRWAKATALTYNHKGVPWEIRGTGLLARALQHEIDHLDGKVFIERLPLMQKIQVQKEVRRYQAIWEASVTRQVNT